MAGFTASAMTYRAKRQCARCAWDCAYRPWQMSRSAFFQRAPPPLSGAGAGGYRWRTWAALGNARQDVQHLAVQLPGIGLAGYRKAPSYPIFCDLLHPDGGTSRGHPQTAPEKLAWVPVVPLGTQKRLDPIRYSRSSRSSSSSCIHRVARLPTVVGWAGWKWVNGKGGQILVLFSERPDSYATTLTSLLRMSLRASVIMMTSVLSPT